jgi:hypothetical protein
MLWWLTKHRDKFQRHCGFYVPHLIPNTRSSFHRVKVTGAGCWWFISIHRQGWKLLTCSQSVERSTRITLSNGKLDMWLWAGRPRGRSSSPVRGKNFHFSMSSRQAMGPNQPPIQWVLGALSPEVKRPGREADHSPPTSAVVKKRWVYTSTPPYISMS